MGKQARARSEAENEAKAVANVLRVRHAALKNLLDRDPRLGYTLQGYISTAYFNRYVDTMKKLQAIVMNIPVEA